MMTTAVLPVIEPATLYPLPVFMQLTKVGKHAMRQARRCGLRVKYAGGKGWVLGRDWIDYVSEHGDDVHRGNDGL